MNEIEKISQSAAHQELVHFEAVPIAAHQEGIFDMVILPVMRHWRAALAVFIAAVAVGLPIIWVTVEPMYESEGAIRIAPNQQPILYKDVEAEAVISNYRTFMNTQVELVSSSQVLDRAADDIKAKNLAVVASDPLTFLSDAFANQTIVVEPPERTELIKIIMKSQSPRDAEEVVNSLIRAYLAVEASNFVKSGDETLAVLEDKLRELSEKRQQQKQVVRQMSEEFGTAALTDRQQMMLQQVMTLQSDMTKLQTHKMDLETQIQMLEKTTEGIIPLEKVMAMRNEFVSADPQLKILSDNVAQLEQGMVVASQTMTAENPELQNRKNLLTAMKARLAERESEIAKNFDDMLKNESARNRDYKLSEVKAELERTVADEEKLKSMLAKHNAETIELGRKQLAIKDQQEQFALTDEMHESVRRRIQELEMERKRPAQISVAYPAASKLAKDRRKKLAAADIFGGGMLGILLALMLDRWNRRVNNPEDVQRRIGVRLLGTTVNPSKVDHAMLNDRISDDYQAIRANLGLFNNEKIPHVLAITSANAREGKTTFAINLATSMAKAGTKVLLVDGDMRKPEIGILLKSCGDPDGVRKVLLGKGGKNVVWSVPSTGLEVLCSDIPAYRDFFEILARPQAVHSFAALCAEYENVIIDTPPILAVSDALLWAKMADAVVLTSFAGQTAEVDLQRASERLKQINAKILGIVVNSVSLRTSYNYGYGYGYGYGRGKRHDHPRSDDDEARRREILLSTDEANKGGSTTS